MKFILLIVSLFFTKYLNDYFLKRNILPNYSGLQHQLFAGSKKIPQSGGIFLFFFLSIIFFDINKLLVLHIFLLLIIGILSDIKIELNPIIRLFVQTLIVVSFIILSELNINFTRILILDYFLSNYYFNIFFVSFCILILINGNNFIDGLNGLVIFYYLFIILILFYLKLNNGLNIDKEIFILTFLSFVFLLFLNFFNQLYLGDSGSYIIGLLFGYLLINLYSDNQSISPFFLVLLLWYPCFELLFSIIRKFHFRKSPISPDKNHLHQLLFFFLYKKFKLKKEINNNLSSFILNSYNACSMFLGALKIYNTSYLIFIILMNILIYTFLYLRLLNFKLNY